MQADHDIAWKHAALILSKKLNAGSAKANDVLRQALLEFGSMDALYDHHFGLIPVDDAIRQRLDQDYSKVGFDFAAVTLSDNRYPAHLRSVKGAPPILYCRGDLSLFRLEKTIAFVGSRDLTNLDHLAHGKDTIERLFRSGYQALVSGLALGSDRLGHTTAIELGQKTIAVLGTPLNQSYPKENRALQEDIARNHLLVSEYPIGIPSFGSFFANRNRTTVGLSTGGIVVARAGDKSGTQHAIRCCIEQGKPLYALENNVQEPAFEWVRKYKDHIKVVRQPPLKGSAQNKVGGADSRRGHFPMG